MIRMIICLILGVIACNKPKVAESPASIVPGAYQLSEYLPFLADKNVGLTINHTSLINGKHLTDTLQDLGIAVTKVFTPEHGFTGKISDGMKIDYDSINTTFELVSLYGKNKKPTKDQLTGVDVMVFDIQDVGARFYTYISTMHYVMESCVENSIPLIILDRPNPNGSYVDGPVLDTTFQSFVGLHPIPIVHGMTIGELAQMINEEGWLTSGKKVDLKVIKIKNWNHASQYTLPIKPSPNLPSDLSIALYPSLCLFEGTVMSVGRGTDYAFQQIGHPDYPDEIHSFTPTSREGSKWPPYEGLVCYGRSWIGSKPQYAFTLQPLLQAYEKMEKADFFNSYFTKLAGNKELQKQIEDGLTETEIRKTWKEDLAIFKQKRNNYLLYK